jgi:protein-tyrosine-phosphatase
MPSVLFVCTANLFRSPLAAAIFQKALQQEGQERKAAWDIGPLGDWTVASAGTWVQEGQPVLRDVLEAGKQLGVDLSAHRSMMVNKQLLAQYDLVLVMQVSHRELLCREYPQFREQIYLLSLVVDQASYDFQDTHRFLQEVLQVGRAMEALIRRNMQYICVLATALHHKWSWVPVDGQAEVEYTAAQLIKVKGLFDPGMVE